MQEIFLHSVHTGSVAHTAFYLMKLFPWDKEAGE
jgi:hypothetical protein